MWWWWWGSCVGGGGAAVVAAAIAGSGGGGGVADGTRVNESTNTRLQVYIIMIIMINYHHQ